MKPHALFAYGLGGEWVAWYLIPQHHTGLMVLVDSDSYCQYSPIRWVPLRGPRTVPNRAAAQIPSL